MIMFFPSIFPLIFLTAIQLQRHVLSIPSLTHNCQQYSCPPAVEIPNPSGPSYLQLVSVAATGVAFTFNATLSGFAGYICVDVGSCVANYQGAVSSLSISYQSTNPGHWSSDLAIGFYGTSQSFGGASGPICSCGSTSIGSFPSQYN